MMRPHFELDTLSVELIGQINKSFAQFNTLGSEVGAKVVDFVNKGREVGLYLDSLRAKRRDWEQLLLVSMEEAESAPPDRIRFTGQYAKSFGRLASRLKGPAESAPAAISSLKDALMAQGTLDFPSGHSHQKLHLHDPASACVKLAMALAAVFNKAIRPELHKWSPERKEALRDQLEPLHQIWEMLK